MPLRHTYFTPGIVAALLCSLCSVPSVRGQERLTSTASNSPLQTEFENRSLRPGTDMRDAYLRNPALIHRMVGERRYFSAENPGFVREKPGTIFIAADGASGRQEGDYLVPNLELDEQPDRPLNRYGRMRLTYLKEHRPILYSEPDRIYGRRKRQRRLERTAQSRTVLALHCCRFDGRRLPL